jgi:hypothetical protein
MPKVVAYGEDPLTYWALTERLSEFLCQLGDSTPPNDTTVIYRPSFGRGGAAKKDSTGGSNRAEFGEFDGIVSTPQAIYLVESKWSRSPEHQEGIVRLRDVQVRRHRLFRWMVEAWRTDHPSSWDAFFDANGSSFTAEFPGMALAPVGSVLAENLEFVLNLLLEGGREIRDVLLHLGIPGHTTPSTVEPSTFRLICISYEPLPGSAYFQLA